MTQLEAVRRLVDQGKGKICPKYRSVFGNVKRETKTKFYVPVECHNTATLAVAILKEWMLPGTTIVSDCCGLQTLDVEVFNYFTVYRLVNFDDPETNRCHP